MRPGETLSITSRPAFFIQGEVDSLIVHPQTPSAQTLINAAVFTYLFPAVTSMAVNTLGSQVKFSISGPYTPLSCFSSTIFLTASIPRLMAWGGGRQCTYTYNTPLYTLHVCALENCSCLSTQITCVAVPVEIIHYSVAYVHVF